MNLAKYKEQLYKTFLRKKKTCILFIVIFFLVRNVYSCKGSWKSNQAITYEHIQFYANYPLSPFPLLPAGEIDLGYIGVPRSPSAAAST